jgi:hypothetical protein
MKTIIIIILILITKNSFSQDSLAINIDNDKILDSVFYQKDNSIFICKLSTQKFKEIKSKTLENSGDQSRISKSKNGFSFTNNWMRAGYSCQFRYDTKNKQIELIGMSHYEFGGATNDGSGEASLNLLTNIYIGNWNYFDEKKSDLISIPTLKRKVIIKNRSLADFGEDQVNEFQNISQKYFEVMKQKMVNKKIKRNKK